MKPQDKIQELRKTRTRIDWMCQNKVNAFSPTISPAPKSTEHNEIESIYEGVRYYVQNGVKDIIIQKKYMGSYCDIYLHKNLNETYFVSRNGYKIEHINLEEAKAACENLHHKFEWTNLEIVIIQSELLPWNILGKELIDREFGGYLDAHKKRMEYFETSNLPDKISKIKSGETYTAYQSDKETMSASAFKKRYPAHVIRQYNSLHDFEMPDLQQYNKGVAAYEQQINHYAKTEPLHFKPFNILKKIFTDGHEEIPNDNRTYSIVNEDEIKVLHVDSEKDIETKVAEIYQWFHVLSNEMEEGIVIKPLQAFVKNMPPAFKVRNNNYLTMIYGVDFQKDLQRQIKKRNIRSKLACSINDWTINYKLLSVPYNEIYTENYYYKNLMLDRILEEETENNLDPTL
jgi:hypothetical protein